eukprot:CAMPEP_0172365820 /NCGR_PEP_ID=MMETSP1060-20121228/12253_1 /TAXON_ID=37318 /ORGANISM="Pseudo-nitzschia pungens, Strain cf. cingulata" /LENGTH=165 /DNA_ID=CAMNT_0013089381 /DNA_START=226 /DNA_END=723 /DNA_ORIENTATION=+
MVPFVMQLLWIASVDGAPASASGRFAVLRRYSEYIDESQGSSLYAFHRRRSVKVCNNGSSQDKMDTFNNNIDHTEESSDTHQIQEGRFAMEYEHERSMMQSAENAHLTHRQETFAENEVHDTTMNTVKSPIETEIGVRSEGSDSKSRKTRRSRTFVYQENNPIFV